MSIEHNLEIIKSAINNGENVIITGEKRVGKTTLLRALEKELEAEHDTKVVYFSGYEHQSSYYETAVNELEIAELINMEQGKKVILIDGLSSFQNTLNYVRQSTRIVAVEQGINESQLKKQLESFEVTDVNFTRIVNL